MTSPNYASLIDDVVEIADRLHHAYAEAKHGSTEKMHLSLADAQITECLSQVKDARDASTKWHIEGIMNRVIDNECNDTDMQRIRKALENFYD